MAEGASLPMDKLYKRMSRYMVHGDEPPTTSQQAQELASQESFELQFTRNKDNRDVLSPPAPPHAFPSPYPPTCSYEPFLSKGGATSFGEPKWRRAPATRGTRPPSTSVTIDELVERFSQLNVRGERPKGSHDPRPHAATVAITVIPSRAPHPSLIPFKNPPKPAVVVMPSVRAPTSRLRAFKSPSPTSKATTLVPLALPAISTKPTRERKTAPLPRRFPNRMQETRRDTTPAMSESSTTSPTCSSRVLSSDSDTRSCSFSSISSFPPSPSNVATTIQEFPVPLGSPCRSIFEVPAHSFGNIFGDMLPTPLSPVF
ncbi:hypothetical protein BU15DRAFT_70849 [Melanogaster broomeanus]|nr:hypothetical protein BU15DRAFT_70849 [Melanogaster broomeanus]